ncbi:D-erythronate dehydrogenase [Caldimonas sp. KR1-144]|uniref:D-erythronate dehydrogenase n=1 Tax=Caldimonas sp. KR1-144 TaxID=3400911 RepID=UPI003C05B15A
MRVLITGGSGFLGARLARTLLKTGRLALAGAAAAEITELRLTDLAPPPADLLADARVSAVTGDLAALLRDGRLALDDIDAVVHLAAAVSAECEADLDLGLRSNLEASLALLQAARHAGRAPVFVFASSVAVFGAAPGRSLPETIEDDDLPVPRSSYGVQKFAVEQLVADFDRRGLVRGRNVRLMTVAVRPGRPNGAASGFLSGMVREPLAGARCVVPVSPETRVALASPGNTVAGLLRALEASADAWGPATAVNLPALSTTAGEIAQALARVAGDEAASRLDWQPDARIAAIVGGWPARFAGTRAKALGLAPDASVEALIRAYAADHPDALQRPLRDA